MRIGVILLCRYSSSRLPGKILMEINGKKVIDYIYERINMVVDKDNIVIATSNDASDDVLCQYALHRNWRMSRGSLHNVSLRFLESARQSNFDFSIRINGDNIFTDILSLSAMIQIASTGLYDLISNVKDRTFPKGMSIEIVRTEKYEAIYNEYYKTDEDFEHVTSFLYKNEALLKPYYYYNIKHPEYSGMQMALDDENDLKRIKVMIDGMQRNHVRYNFPLIMKLIEHEQ